ncbi:MAG: lysophospholipid acyltransferase family protein [Nitrospirota bacterium]
MITMQKFAESSYKTMPFQQGFFARLFPSCLFYADIISIVIRAGYKAKRNRYDNREWIASSQETIHALEKVGVQLEVTGMDAYQPLDKPCVFIGNHMSTLETFVLPSLIAPFRDVTFVVKQALLEYPVFKHVMRSRNPIAVGRSNPRDDLRAVLEGGTEKLHAGISLIIFPQATQTTRSVTFDPESFNTIGIKLAKKAGVPVIPFALKTDAWGLGTFLKDYGEIDPAKKVYFAFDKPLMIKDRGIEEHQQIIAFIQKKLKEWEEENRKSRKD